MSCWICVTCGVQYARSAQSPAECMICEDERQYVGWGGQQWTTPEELRHTHVAEVREEESDLVGIGMSPTFAIGQRALLIRTSSGNVLWDCIPLLDDRIAEAVRQLGGISAIAVSHPHFYSSLVDWGRAFDAPVLLPIADRQWIARPDPCIQLWDGDRLTLHDGITVVRCGGHFPGAAVLHWPAGAAGRGALLVGDTIMVGRDRRQLSFMRSYPNLIPLSLIDVQRIVRAVEPLEFDRIWSGWWSQRVEAGAKAALHASTERYRRALTLPADG
ncbi:hypothetical protein BH23GEM9_BH23GEM9_22070 [soil metagenome]